MKPREISERIKSTLRDDGLGTMTQYTALIGTEKTTYCLHGDLYTAYRESLDGLICGCETIWAERKGEKFFLFACTDHSQDVALRKTLQLIGRKERRLARQRNAPGHHLKEHYRMLWAIQNGRCYFSGVPLGKRFEDREFSIDHLHPLAVRPPPFSSPKGTNWPVNLALVTTTVNRAKGARSPYSFLAEVRKYKSFVPVPGKERRRIDKLRYKLFGEYMREHCSNDEDDWGPTF